MTIEKRLRGRPRGSEKNDAPYLAQVADLLLRDQLLKPTTAMKRVMASRKDWGASDETLLRRWQVKWKERQQAFMAAARERARPKAIAPMMPGSVWYVAASPAMKAAQEAVKAIQGYINSPATQAAQEEAIRAVQGYYNSPAMQVAQEAMRAVQGYVNSPAIRSP